MASEENHLARAYVESLHVLQGLFARTLSGEISDQAAIFQAAPTQSHILWVIGHATWFLETVIQPWFGGQAALPESYGELFPSGTQPVAEASRYPSLQELTAHLNETIERMIALVAAKSDAELTAPLPEGSPLAKDFPSLGSLIPFAVFHTSYHAGQISLLRRFQGLPTGFGF
jgi:hypothetical protein